MKNTTKVCPICIAGANNYVGRCIGEDCAWFLEYADDCAVPVISGILADSTICQNIFKVSKRYVEQEVDDGD